ncbi:MAG: glutamate racemase [Planctomycetota bacterium]|jgi:glutamate racemase|nr:glutamate racemase [Planctomycetota bacterium]
MDAQREKSRVGEKGSQAPVGVLDSGLGGLSVLQEIWKQLPSERTIYCADCEHLPFGPRPMAEVRKLVFAMTEKLLEESAKIIVLACNTASAAALKELRSAFPDIPFVGMEPAVKVAANGTRQGKLGILATQATFQGELFENVVERYARNVKIYRQACPGLAECIETHSLDHPAIRSLLEKYVRPLLDRGVDEIVLACTHYPLVKDAIAEMAGPGIEIIDPSPAIARRTAQIMTERKMLNDEGMPEKKFWVSGNAQRFGQFSREILGQPAVVTGKTFCRL